MNSIISTIQNYFSSQTSDCARIFHGRGHCFPGYEDILIDWYPPVVLITLFTDYPSELLDSISQEIKEGYPQVTCLVLQRRFLPRAPYEVLWGDLPDNHLVSEDDLKFKINFIDGTQNSGLFLDMIEGRRWLKNNAAGKLVLNLFSYTCALSVAALKGGADHVVNIDLSRASLNTGRENHRINDLDTSKVEFFALDILKSWSRLRKKGPYDLVIIDPPSFQKGSFAATKDYRKIIRRLHEFTKTNTKVFACLNSPELDSQFLLDLFKDECPQAQFIKRLPTAETFPEKHPENNLKILLFEIA
jgi:23S rRNA (cytosine1962-C5)-methyltransferase